MRILIIKLGSIGDVVHTLPALVSLRKKFASAEIFWAVEEKSFPILEDNPLLDWIIPIRKSNVSELFDSIRLLRSVKPDVAIDFQGLLKSALLAKLSGARRRIGFCSEALREPFSRWFLNEQVKIPDGKIHVIEKNLFLVANSLEINYSFPEKLSFPIFAREQHREEAEIIARNVDGEFAILNPAGGWATKLWNAENFGYLADMIWEKFGISSVVTGTPAESELVERVLKSSKSGKLIKAYPSLKGFYELAKMARIYVGGDTGPTHIAVAAGAPIVGIFGPTEWWRNGSPYPEDICVERTDISCRADCHRRFCHNWICMNISVETVFNAVERRLSGICLEKSVVL